MITSIGTSTSQLTELAVKSALAHLFTQTSATTTKALLVWLCPEIHEAQVTLDFLKKYAPDFTIVSSSTKALGYHNQADSSSPTLALLALGDSTTHLRATAANYLNRDPKAVVSSLSQQLTIREKSLPTVWVLGTPGWQHYATFSQNWQQQQPNQTVFGFTASATEPSFPVVCLNKQLVTESLVALALDTKQPAGWGVANPFTPVGIARAVTSSQLTSLYTLDDQPALAIYTDTFGNAVPTDPALFSTWSHTYPLGIFLASNPKALADIVAPHRDSNQNLMVPFELKTGDQVSLMLTCQQQIEQALQSATKMAIAALSTAPRFLIVGIPTLQACYLQSLQSLVQTIRTIAGENPQILIVETSGAFTQTTYSSAATMVWALG